MVSDYLTKHSNKLSDNLREVFRKLLTQEIHPTDYIRNIVKLSPQQFGALALSNLQSGTRIARQMSRADLIYQRKILVGDEKGEKKEKDRQNGGSTEHTVWMNPIGFYYKERGESPKQFPFDVATYGFTLGYRSIFPGNSSPGGGVGYTYSDLKWSENQGKAVVQSVYVAPSFSYVGEIGYGSAVLSGGASFYNVDRKIEFDFLDVKETAHSEHASFDLIVSLSGGLKLKMATALADDFCCIPTLNLDFVNIFEEKYEESGASFDNLSIAKKLSAFFRPEFTLRLVQKVSFDNFSIIPTFYFGWLKNIPLNQAQSRFEAKILGGELRKVAPMVVESYRRLKDQFVIGAELTAFYGNQLSLKGGYEANLVGSTYVQGGTLGLDWKF